MNFIKLNFTGVLQHYSPTKYVVIAPSSTYYRTERFPTKKSVIGLISASFGYDRNDERIKDLYNKLVCRYRTVRTGSVIIDYQTVRSLNPNERFKNFSGGNSDKNAIIKTVEYLQDYSFEVFIGCEDDTLFEIYKALVNPVYHQYFGKRSCVLSESIVSDFNLIKEEDITDVYDCT